MNHRGMLRSFAVRRRVARGRRPVAEGLEPRRLLATVTTQSPIAGASLSPQAAISAATATTATLYPSMNPVPFNQPLVLTVTVTPAPGSGTPTGTVTFNTDRTVPLNAQGVATLVLTGTDYTGFFGGDYTAKLIDLSAVYSGDATHEPSASNTIMEFINPPDGPRVTSLARTGSATSTTGLVFTFDGPLHPQTAQNPSNYVIVAANGRKIPVTSAVYNEATLSVTVRPRTPLSARGTYIVTIVGVGPTGVTDVEGRLLDGTYIGQPGTSYSTVIVPARLRLVSAVPTAPRFTSWTRLALESAAHRASR